MLAHWWVGLIHAPSVGQGQVLGNKGMRELRAGSLLVDGSVSLISWLLSRGMPGLVLTIGWGGQVPALIG